MTEAIEPQVIASGEVRRLQANGQSGAHMAGRQCEERLPDE